jgi:hypothetical protein
MSGTQNTGEQLRDLLTDLRAELGHSTNVAHGINDRDTLIYYLNRTQRTLYQDYDWPQLIIDRDIALADGQRYYTYPPDLAFEDINHIWVMINTVYNELVYGIGPYEMVIWNSDKGFKSWPTQRWMHHPDDNTFELWPVPDANAASTGSLVRLRGTKFVPWLVNDSDTCVLPNRLIVLFAAVELLQRDNAKDAAMKLQKANEVMRRHRVRQFSHKRRAIEVGAGGGDAQSRPARQPVLGLDYIPPGYGSGPPRLP